MQCCVTALLKSMTYSYSQRCSSHLARLLLILLGFSFSHQIAAQTYTLTRLSAYYSLRPCAQNCLLTQALPGLLGCGPQYLDACVCRNDFASTASSILTSCVNSLCKTFTVDVIGAISVYNEYCPGTQAIDRTTPPTVGVPTATAADTTHDSPTARPPGTVRTTIASKLLQQPCRRVRILLLFRPRLPPSQLM